MLVDHRILYAWASGELGIEPFDPALVGPGTLDLRAAEDISIPRNRVRLTHTIERFRFGPRIGGTILMCSTEAREGLDMIRAQWFDPGFEGVPTLELVYHGSPDPDREDDPSPYRVRRGQTLCQILFEFSDTPAECPYNHPSRQSRYSGQTGTTPARL